MEEPSDLTRLARDLAALDAEAAALEADLRGALRELDDGQPPPETGFRALRGRPTRDGAARLLQRSFGRTAPAALVNLQRKGRRVP